jgi:Zn-dependent peptidase ImmA (M78 family)
MKKIMFFAVLMICIACNNSSKEKSSNENEITELEKYYQVADMFLEFDAEKVGLLSIIKEIPQEKVNSVLRDYLAKTLGNSLFSLEDPKYIVKVVDTIAEENGLSKKMTASIIFTYRYEMITEDEIIEEYSTNR